MCRAASCVATLPLRPLCPPLRLLQPGAGVQEALFPLFAQFVLERYTAEIKAYR